MKNFLVWLLFVIIGGAVIYYSAQMSKMFGRIRWAEQNLWSTRSAYVLGGFVLIVLWFLMMMWMIEFGWWNLAQLGQIESK